MKNFHVKRSWINFPVEKVGAEKLTGCRVEFETLMIRIIWHYRDCGLRGSTQSCPKFLCELLTSYRRALVRIFDTEVGTRWHRLSLLLSSPMKEGAGLQQLQLQNVCASRYWSFRFFTYISVISSPSFMLSLIVASDCNREGLYETECRQSPAMYLLGWLHLNSKHCHVHTSWVLVTTEPNSVTLCWAKSEGNLLTSAEPFCICLHMAENGIYSWEENLSVLFNIKSVFNVAFIGPNPAF